MAEQLSKEQVARMYGAYIGCECRVLQTSGGGFEFKEWWQEALLTGIKESTMVEVQLIYEHYAEEEASHYEFPECQPILTPISAISDEDGVVIASIYGGVRVKIDDNMMQIIDKDDRVPKWFVLSQPLPSNLSDYLRSKGYDCGFMHISSLIEAGYAINKKI